MKSNRILLLLLFCVTLTLTLGGEALRADQAASAAGGTNESQLIGSDSKLEEMVPKSDVIFVGEFIDLGFGSYSASGEIHFQGGIVKVLRILRGSANEKIMVFFTRQDLRHESLPTINTAYVFFVHIRHGQGKEDFSVMKIIPATADNITKVKALIAAAPPPK